MRLNASYSNPMEGNYAGDAAWREWFAICSVDGCSAVHSRLLRMQVSSAMYAQLGRFGLSREAAGTDDPVAYFDGYFKLKGSREKGKPLKLYFAYRIRSEGLRLFDFVCGTLFGSRSGRVHDIALDWITSLKGWKARVVRGADGCRRLAWETTGETGTPVEQPVDLDPAAAVEADFVRAEASSTLSRLVARSGVEKAKAALLLYATAQDISITESAVLASLGVGKSMAYRLRDRLLGELQKEMRRNESAADPLFGRLLLEACESALEEGVRRALTGGDR